MDISYRPRHKKDQQFLVHVSMRTMNQIIIKSTGRPLTEARILKQINENQTTEIIESAKRPIGYYSYSILPSGQMYLSAVVLSPEMQHRGIGRRVAKHIEGVALSKGIDTILGHIHYANRQSLIFWLKNGYRILGPHMKGTLAVEKRLRRWRKITG